MGDGGDHRRARSYQYRQDGNFLTAQLDMSAVIRHRLRDQRRKTRLGLLISDRGGQIADPGCFQNVAEIDDTGNSAIIADKEVGRIEVVMDDLPRQIWKGRSRPEQFQSSIAPRASPRSISSGMLPIIGRARSAFDTSHSRCRRAAGWREPIQCAIQSGKLAKHKAPRIRSANDIRQWPSRQKRRRERRQRRLAPGIQRNPCSAAGGLAQVRNRKVGIALRDVIKRCDLEVDDAVATVRDPQQIRFTPAFRGFGRSHPVRRRSPAARAGVP